jgi:hypothetical protein
VEGRGPARERDLDGLDARAPQLARTAVAADGATRRVRRSTSTPEDQVITPLTVAEAKALRVAVFEGQRR